MTSRPVRYALDCDPTRHPRLLARPRRTTTRPRLQAHPGAELVAAWDEDAARGRGGRGRTRRVPFHEDLAELLARPDIDGVIVTTRTSAHPEVIIAAAAAGKHIFTEKVLALTPAEAQQIVEAVDAEPRQADRLAAATDAWLHARDSGGPGIGPAGRSDAGPLPALARRRRRPALAARPVLRPRRSGRRRPRRPGMPSAVPDPAVPRQHAGVGLGRRSDT